MTLGGYHPFDGQGDADVATTSRNIRSAPPDFDDPIWEGVSEEAKSLLLGLLRKVLHLASPDGPPR